MMNNYGYQGYGHAGHMLGWGIGGLFVMVLFWIAIVWLIVAVLRRVVWGSSHRHDRWKQWQDMKGASSGINILNERYAKGEINKEEYEQKKKDILG
jgi:putative membrane protein